MQVERWDVLEIAVKGPGEGNPFVEQTFEGTFTGKNETITTAGFYDGDGVYKVRFMPSFEGEYTYKTTGSFPEAETQGSFTVTPATGNHHGPVRVANITAPPLAATSPSFFTRVPSGKSSSFSPPWRQRIAVFIAATSLFSRFTGKAPSFKNSHFKKKFRNSSILAMNRIPELLGRARAMRMGSMALLWLAQSTAPPAGTCSRPMTRMGHKRAKIGFTTQ